MKVRIEVAARDDDSRDARLDATARPASRNRSKRVALLALYLVVAAVVALVTAPLIHWWAILVGIVAFAILPALPANRDPWFDAN